MKIIDVCHTLRGGGLVYALVMLVIISIVFTGLITFVGQTMRFSFTSQPREAALQIAEAGIYSYRWYLAHTVDGKTSEEVSKFWEGTSPPPRASSGPDGVCDASEYYEEDYNANGVAGTFRLCASLPETGVSESYLISTGWTAKKPSQKRTVRVRLRRPSWSEFAILAHSAIEITSGSTITGSVHGNNGVLVDGSATGIVTSGVTSYDHDNNPGTPDKDGVWTNGDESSVFLGGKKFPAPIQDFNSVVVTFAEIQEASDAQFNLPSKAGGQGWHLHFNADGTVDVCWVKKYDKTTKALDYSNKSYDCDEYDDGAGNHYLTLSDSNAIYARNDIWIDGVIDSGKRVTIAAHHTGGGREHNIYINGDIVYEDYASDTVLGIAAEQDIEIIADPDIVGEGYDDSVLEIDGALLSQTGRVGRSAYGTTLDAVKIFGAVATYQDYGFQDTTTVDVIYDSNFLTSAPPFFPAGSSYAIDRWDEVE